MKKKIERISNLGEVGVNRPGQPRQPKFMVSVEWQDGTEDSFMLDGECGGYLEDGFVVKVGGKWLFYDAEGKLLAENECSRYGDCTEVSVNGGFYIFDKDVEHDRERGVNHFAIAVDGTETDFLNPTIGWHVSQLFANEPDDDMEDEDMDLESSFVGWSAIKQCYSKMQENESKGGALQG